MSASTAIGMVSESLRDLLLGEMVLDPQVNVTILSPDESGGNRRINLFLYKVQENEVLRNTDWQLERGSANRLVPPPLSLNLFYLLTPYAQNDPQTGNAVAHQILGDAMRVLYENPFVPEQYLAGGLVGARERIKITLNPLPLDEISTVWNTFSEPFRLSVPYEVSVVQLDMLPAKEREMAPRVRRVGVPDVRAPFHPPFATTIVPASGPAGSLVTVQGEHLEGWRASVAVAGNLIVEGTEIAGPSFDFTLPADLSSGFYELRIDISHLHRSTFFFEVTT